MEKILRLREILKNSRRICVFTGAGISVPSGIPDFRSEDGLYSGDCGQDASWTINSMGVLKITGAGFVDQSWAQYNEIINDTNKTSEELLQLETMV